MSQTEKNMYCRVSKTSTLFDQPLHHLRNLFQLLVDAVLEIIGQVCDSLFVVCWMRLVKRCQHPPKKKNDWNPSQSWSMVQILDGLSCSHCPKIPGLKFMEISQNGVRGIQNHSDMPFSSHGKKSTKWQKLRRHDKVSCFWSSTSLISFLSFSVCNCLASRSPNCPFPGVAADPYDERLHISNCAADTKFPRQKLTLLSCSTRRRRSAQ